MYNDLNEIGSNFFKNKRQEEKLVDLTPHYTLTKVSSNNYHLFNAETKSGETLNRAEVLHRVASINGSSELSTENIKALDSLANFDSVIIPTSALQLKTKASFDTMSVDPWKLVEVNGTKYFVENLIEVKSEDDKPEEVITKTASVHVAPTSYTVVAHTRGITESGLVAKACDCCCKEAEDNRYVNLSFDMNEPNKLSFNINFTGTPEELLEFLQEQVKKMGVYLPNSAFDVYPNGDQSCTGHQVFPQTKVTQQRDAVYIVETPESTKISASPSLETLKVYAKAHYNNYVIKDKDLNVVASHLDNKDNRQSFSSMLSDTLMQLHRTAADEENINQVGANIKNLNYHLLDAAMNGKNKDVQILVSKGATDIDGALVMLANSKTGDVDTAKFLIEHGAKSLQDALKWAVLGDNTDMVNLLIDSGADINAKGLYGRTPLMAAIYTHNTDLAKLLINKGADLTTPQISISGGSYTPLEYAKLYGRTDIVNYIESLSKEASLINTLHKTAEENINLQDSTGDKVELDINPENLDESTLTKKDTGEQFQSTGDPNTPFTGSQGEKVKITDKSGQPKKLDELQGLPTNNLKLQIEDPNGGDIQQYDEEDF